MNHLLKKRAIIIFWAFILVFTGMGGHLAYIQLYSGQRLSRQAVSQQSQTVALEVIPRGKILDRNLKPLSIDREVSRVVVFPLAVIDKQREGRVLATVLGTTVQEMEKYLSGRPGIIPVDLSARQVEALKKQSLPGIVPAKVSIRDRQPLMASHLLGYVGKGASPVGWVGQMGLESRYDSDLQGNFPLSTARVFLDARGKVIQGLGCVIENSLKDTKRKDVVLTIDSRIQETVEKTLEKAGVRDGAVVVMDAGNGDILAMASRPEYSLDNPYATAGLDATAGRDSNAATPVTVSEAAYQSFVNHCLSMYQPGSVFKVVVAAAALEEGIVKPDTVFLCTGENDDLVKCYRKEGHGLITFDQAVAYSCNPTFARVGLKLGAQKLIEYAKKMGLDNRNIIGLDRKNRLDLTAISRPYNLVNASLGQWPVEATVVQITAMMAVIANDGVYVPPRIVREVRNPDGTPDRVFQPGKPVRAISAGTAGVVKSMLEMVTRYGTGTNAMVEGWGSAGKTGSAQVGEEKVDAWFSGYAPAGSPRYVAAVMVDNGESGGKTAAPLFREIMQEILK